MYNTSDAYKTAISQPSRELKARITLGNNVIDDNYIVSITHDNGIFAGDDFEIGTAVMAMANVELIDKNGDLNYTFEDQEINIEIAPKLADGTYEYVPLGLFTVEAPKKKNKKIQFSACDRMYKFEVPYASTLVYPTTLLAIAQDICSIAGVTLKNTSFVNSDYSCPSVPVLEGVTCRKAIAQVAELAGGYAHITRDGQLEIVNLGSTVVSTITSLRSFNNKDLPMASIDKVVVKLGAEQAEAGTGTNPLYVVDNMFVNDPNSVVTALYNALNGLTYMPYEMTFKGDPSLDCGDKVTVVAKNTAGSTYGTFHYGDIITPAENVTYTTIIGSRKLTYKGGLNEEYSAPGKSNTERNSTGKGNLTIAMEQTKTEIKVMKGEIDQNVTEISSLGGRVTTAETNITQNANAIALKADKTVTDSLGNQIGSINSELDIQAGEIAAKVNTADMASEITQHADSVKIAVEQIGGNNLLKNSGNVDSIINWIVLQQNAGAGTVMRSTGNDAGVPTKLVWFTRATGISGYCYLENNSILDYKFKIGQKYTLSMYYYVSMAMTLYLEIADTNANNVVHASNWALPSAGYYKKTITFTPTINGSNPLIRFYGSPYGFNLGIVNIQLEEGANATAWRPNASELKGTHYTFDGDSFKIGGASGDIAEHSPSISKWTHSDGSYSQADANGFKRYSGSNQHEYHYLAEVGEIGGGYGTDEFSYTVQLPDEFKGKDFKVAVSMRTATSTELGASVIDFNVYVESYDYPNGRFTAHIRTLFYNFVMGRPADVADIDVAFSYIAIA